MADFHTQDEILTLGCTTGNADCSEVSLLIQSPPLVGGIIAPAFKNPLKQQVTVCCYCKG